MSPIDDALDQLRHHRGLASVGEPMEERGATWIEVGVRVELPSRERAAGVSATGVKVVEPCILAFPPDYPLKAPRPNLRGDFPLTFPHINPYRPGNLVSPCVYEGSLDELLHQDGLDAIVDQVIDWLHNAAAGTLINLQQGWEPTRRDHTPSTIVFSAEKLCAAAPTDGAIMTLGARYHTLSAGVLVHLDSLAPAPAVVFDQTTRRAERLTWATGTCATFVCAAPHVDGKPQVDATYRPETVVDLETLLERAAEHGIDRAALDRALEDYRSRSVLTQHEDGPHDARKWTRGLYAIVILLVQRPTRLIGASERSVECLPYVVHFEVDPKNPFDRKSSVHSGYHAHAVSPELLARTSGVAPAVVDKKLVMVGCGSVGSKIAMHLGRAGFGNVTFVDKEGMSPHNLARHALSTTVSEVLPGSKSMLMAEEFKKLSHIGMRAFDTDAVKVLSEPADFTEVVPSDTALIVESTASMQILAATVQSSALTESNIRLARAALYRRGNCAVLMLEGAARSCRVDDLEALLFEMCRYAPEVRARLGAVHQGEPIALYVGDNCRSLTTPMSDAVVSRGVAPMALEIERWLTHGLPEAGQLSMGVVDRSGLGMTWSRLQVQQTKVVQASGDGGWSVRVLHNVARYIDGDARHWGELETGGALIGRIFHELRTITVAGLVPAPPDSVRKRDRFELGTEGLVQSLKLAHADSLGHLSFIGTWHSHPEGGKHSGLDRETLRKIAEDAGGRPAVSLVWTPSGLTCEVDRW